jgi:hypothetical protein
LHLQLETTRPTWQDREDTLNPLVLIRSLLNRIPAENLDSLRKEYTRASRELTRRRKVREKTQPVNPIIRVPSTSDAGQIRSTHDISAGKADNLSKHKYLEVETEPGYSKIISIEALVKALHKNDTVAQEIFEELKIFEPDVAEKGLRHDQ